VCVCVSCVFNNICIYIIKEAWEVGCMQVSLKYVIALTVYVYVYIDVDT
jgi:hypothetical protein